MSKNARDRRPYIKPVTRLELSETNIKIRWIAIAVLLAIAVVAIGYGFSLALRTEPGWQVVSAYSDEVNCSGDFILQYDFSAGDANPTAVNKKLEVLYTQLTEDAYHLFYVDAEGTDNLYHINANVNKTVTVDPALYRALEMTEAAGNRNLYMAPAAQLYEAVFLSAADPEAALYDPSKDEELGKLAGEMAAYAADPEMVSLKLMGENQVCLMVSDAYLAFAGEYGISVFLDFGWMKNAFIADYMAQALIAEGFVHGNLTSYDGFTRNLDSRGTEYTITLFNRQGNDIRMPANFQYHSPMNLVSLRDYPMSERDRWHYYAYEDGSITSVFLNPEDGMPGCALSDLMAYSPDACCAEILLKIIPVFIGENFDAYALESLAQEGIHSIRGYGDSLVCTEETAEIILVDEAYTLTYSSVE